MPFPRLNLSDDQYLGLASSFLGGAPGDITGSMGHAAQVLAQMRAREREEQERQEALERELEDRKKRDEERQLRMRQLRGSIEDAERKREISREQGPGSFEYEKALEMRREIGGTPEEYKASQVPQGEADLADKIRAAGGVRQWIRSQKEDAEDRTLNREYKRAVMRPKTPTEPIITPNSLLSAKRKELQNVRELRQAAKLNRDEETLAKLDEMEPFLENQIREIERKFNPANRLQGTAEERLSAITSSVPPADRQEVQLKIGKLMSRGVSIEDIIDALERDYGGLSP